MRHVPFIDATGCQNLKAVIKTLQANHTRVMLSGVNPGVLNELERSGISNGIGKENIYDLFDQALNDALLLHESKHALHKPASH